jgi:5'(3')-deoxyribonucleotidase
MQKRVYVDMDGVLADYYTAYVMAINSNPKNQYPQTEYGFFTSLPPIKGALRGIEAVAKHYDTWILTRPSMHNPLCYTEKRVWVEQNLGMEWVKRLIISPSKDLMIGDYLIDDSPWPNFQGEQLRFGSAECPNWDAVMRQLGVV